MHVIQLFVSCLIWKIVRCLLISLKPIIFFLRYTCGLSVMNFLFPTILCRSPVIMALEESIRVNCGTTTSASIVFVIFKIPKSWSLSRLPFLCIILFPLIPVHLRTPDIISEEVVDIESVSQLGANRLRTLENFLILMIVSTFVRGIVCPKFFWFIGHFVSGRKTLQLYNNYYF